MATFVSPGVYTRELDFSAFAARQAGTVMAFVGTASKGPTDKAVLLTARDRLTKTYGPPLATAGNRANFGLHAAYNALAQTNQVWYRRVTDGTEKVATAESNIIINNQIVFDVDDSSGITISGGELGFTLEVRLDPGKAITSDTYDALVRRFGAKNIFDGNYNPITNLSELETALALSSPSAGHGVCVNVRVRLDAAGNDVEFERVEHFVNRFRSIMQNGPVTAEERIIEDSSGVRKYVVFRTRNLADELAQNLQFRFVPDLSGAVGFATATYENGAASPTTDDMVFTAKQPGLIGNGISVTIVDGGAALSGLPPVAVDGRDITITIDEGVTTSQDIIDAIDASSAARLLITAELHSTNDGSATVTSGTITLDGGGMNLPSASITVPSGTSLSTTWAQIQRPYTDGNSTYRTLRFSADSPGDFANGAQLSFGKDAFDLQTITYTQGEETETAVELAIVPSGQANSFIDFVPSFDNLGEFAAADYNLLADETLGGSLDLAVGTVDVFGTGTPTSGSDLEWFAWSAYEFNSAVNPVFAGGRAGIPDDYDDIVDEIIGNAADSTGIYTFQNREQFDNSLLATPGFDQSAVIRAGIKLAEDSGDMLYIVDGPGGQNLTKGLTAQEIVDWHNGKGFGNSAAFNSSYGAFWHGWTQIFDEFNAVDHWVPNSVTVAEQIGFNDLTGELWFAPAGFRRGRLLRAKAIQENAENNQGDRDFMYSGGNAVNPIVNFLNEGIVLFGQRTLQRNPSALDRINVRRLLNFVKRVSAATVRPDLFQPLDDILFRQLTTKLRPIFEDIKSRRGLNRFEVKIDSTTTTDLNRDNSEVVGYIIIEPRKAAEKIILNFVITAQGASFSEALAAAGVA